MIKKTHVYTTMIEKEVFNKYDVDGTVVEVPDGGEKPSESARLIGWRTDVRKVKYRVPIEDFMKIAEKV